MTEEQLTEYVRAYHGSLLRLAFSYVKNREDAEDIVQEAFIRLMRSGESFSGQENVKAWLIRVAINLCKDMLRSPARSRRGELSEDIPCESAEEYGLLECIRRMKPEHAAVLYLYYYEGYSVKETARILRISATAVSTRLSRARVQLKKTLLKEGLFNEE